MRELVLTMLLVVGSSLPVSAAETIKIIRSYTLPPATNPISDHPAFVISETTLAEQPNWEGPEVSEPPLTIAEATRIATGEFRKYTEVGEMRVMEVSLRNLEIGPTRGWVYIITWRTCADCEGLDIPVLLSGRPVIGQSD